MTTLCSCTRVVFSLLLNNLSALYKQATYRFLCELTIVLDIDYQAQSYYIYLNIKTIYTI